MDELIEVTEKDGIQSVSARELYEKLEIATAFKDWFPRICDYGFCIGIDFNPLKIEQVRKEGNRDVTRELQDYAISIEMAKQICMLQRTEIGKQYRDYFIRLEKAWNTPEAVMARALQFANKTLENAKSVIAQQKQQLIEQRPKVEFFDAVASSHDAIDMGNVAKVLECKLGRNQIFDILRRKGVLQSNNVPYQKFIDAGFFRVIEQKYGTPDGSVHVNIKTLVYQRGIDYIRKIIQMNQKEGK
jgi:anti-repressor protein